MANVLLVDARETSGYLALSLVRGLRHRGSLSTCRAEALRKAQTGLFDIVYVDVDSADPVSDIRLIREVDVLMPGAPIVRVADPDLDLPAQPIFAHLHRPLTFESLTHCLRQATARLAHLSLERRHAGRKDVDVAVRIEVRSRRLLARAINLSLRGALVELPAFEILDEPKGCSLDFRLGRRRIHLEAAVRYSRIQGNGCPQLGVSFTGVGSDELEGLRKILAA